MPVKKTKGKYQRIQYEVVLDKDLDMWKWTISVQNPILYEGAASTHDKALAMAKRKIDSL